MDSGSCMKRFARGQAAVALSLALPVLVGAALLGCDSAIVYRQRIELQATADRAVLLGAAYLPRDPAKAADAAQKYARHADVSVIYDQVSSDRRSLTMVVRRRIHYILGRKRADDVVIASATARIGTAPSATFTASSPDGTQARDSVGIGTTLSRNDCGNLQAHPKHSGPLSERPFST